MKTLLVSFFNDEAYGLRSIHSTLVLNGFDAKLLFFKLDNYREKTKEEETTENFIGKLDEVLESEIDLLVEFVEKEKFDVVGFSLVSQHFNLFKRIQKKLKNVIVIVGGWQASLEPLECLQFADYVCVGEGEEPTLDLIRRLSNKETTNNIQNIYTKTTTNKVRQLNTRLFTLPIPIFSDIYSYIIENNQLLHQEPQFQNSRYGTFIGRGCPFACTYCSNSFMKDKIYPNEWTKIRYRSIEHVKKELLYVKKTLLNIKSINFYDEIFSPSLSWTKEFFAWYKEEINLPFYCFFYPGLCNEEKAEVLSEAGMKGVWLGIQSGSQRVRDEIFKRHYTNELVLKQAEIFKKYNISVRYDFIFDNPFESFDESLESIYLMLKLPVPFSLNLFSLKFFPNTEITKMAEEKGIISKNEVDDKDRNFYFIRKDVGTEETKFIKLLAYKISQLSSTLTDEDRNEISTSIEDFRCHKD